MAASALQKSAFVGQSVLGNSRPSERDELSRAIGKGSRITMRRTIKSAPQSIW
jgi:light-harvesting complex II chlorophyll a/b binding protein 2